MNNVYLEGYVNHIKEGQTQSGTSKCTFTLGVPRRKKNPQEQTQYDNIRVTAYGNVGSYLIEGAKAFVSGSFRTYSFQDQQSGQNIKISEVAANKVVLIPQEDRQQYQNRSNQSGPPQYNPNLPQHTPAPPREESPPTSHQGFKPAQQNYGQNTGYQEPL